MQDCKDIKGKEYVLYYFLNWSKQKNLPCSGIILLIKTTEKCAKDLCYEYMLA